MGQKKKMAIVVGIPLLFIEQLCIMVKYIWNLYKTMRKLNRLSRESVSF